MKYIGFLALALLITPSLASAQNDPPMPPPGATGPSGDMQQTRAQMMQLRQQARSQMLEALSGPHRTLLASVVGQLAIASAPDLRGAAQQLDSALSPQESQAILAAEASMRAQANAPAPTRAPDAGLALLRAALAFGGPARPN